MSTSFTRSDLISELASRIGQDLDATDKILSELLDIIEHEVASGNTVAIRGFGRFQLRRIGKPIARQSIDKNFPDSMLMTASFRPGERFKDRIRVWRRINHISNLNLPPEQIRELQQSADPATHYA